MAHEQGIPIEGKVTAIAGAREVEVGARCAARSQLGVRYVGDPNTFRQTLRCVGLRDREVALAASLVEQEAGEARAPKKLAEGSTMPGHHGHDWGVRRHRRHRRPHRCASSIRSRATLDIISRQRRRGVGEKLERRAIA
jgi:hypothetical protein